MELTRIFNLRHFDTTARRFRDVVLRHSQKPSEPADTPDGRGGISVFEFTCACPDAVAVPNCPCEHITKYYGDVAQEPCAYWNFNSALLEKLAPSDAGKEPPQRVF